MSEQRTADAVLDVIAEALHANPDFDDPNVNNPNAWDLAAETVAALAEAEFVVHRADPELAKRLDVRGEPHMDGTETVFYPSHPGPGTVPVRLPRQLLADLRRAAALIDGSDQ